jgi:hypothetical protein
LISTVRIYSVFILFAFAAVFSGTAQPKDEAQKLESNFQKAIEKGDVTKIRNLAAQGAAVDPAGTAVNDFDPLSLRQVRGLYLYKLECPSILLGPSWPMRLAIDSIRPESVNTLLSLGAKVDKKFHIGLEIGCPMLSTDYFCGAIKMRLPISCSGGGGAVVAVRQGDDFISSSMSPKSASPATYITLANELLLSERNEKKRHSLQDIIEILRKNGCPEY